MNRTTKNDEGYAPCAGTQEQKSCYGCRYLTIIRPPNNYLCDKEDGRLIGKTDRTPDWCPVGKRL